MSRGIISSGALVQCYVYSGPVIFTASLLQSGLRDKAYGTAYFVWAGVKGGFALGFDAFRFLGTHLLEWRLSKYIPSVSRENCKPNMFWWKKNLLHNSNELQNKNQTRATGRKFTPKGTSDSLWRDERQMLSIHVLPASKICLYVDPRGKSL